VMHPRGLDAGVVDRLKQVIAKDEE
jgi:hypothetical protein